MLAQNTDVACTERTRGDHEFPVAQCHGFGARQPAIGDPALRRERDDHDRQSLAQEGNDGNGEQRGGKAQKTSRNFWIRLSVRPPK